ncbi:MAG: molybdenum cofactor guanylyltransferase [Bacillaceae bacterium]|nr:molybdenum cofactor guanylyltransferase [Bacillaceae bacterium]
MDAALILLAGGSSRRMGRNKAVMPVGGVPVTERILNRMSPLFSEIIIVSGEPGLFREYPVTVITDVDEFAGRGPLAGIYSGMAGSRHDRLFVSACDMPFVSSELAAYLLEQLDDETDAVVPVAGGKVHPLFSAWHRRIQSELEQTLREKQYRMIDFLDRIRVKNVAEHAFRHLADPDKALMNVNTPVDLKKAEQLAQRK